MIYQGFPSTNESKFFIDPEAMFIVIYVPEGSSVKVEVTSISMLVVPLFVQAANTNKASDEE